MPVAAVAETVIVSSGDVSTGRLRAAFRAGARVEVAVLISPVVAIVDVVVGKVKTTEEGAVIVAGTVTVPVKVGEARGALASS